MEGAHSLSPFKRVEREDPARIQFSRDRHPNISEAQPAVPIFRNERRPRAGSEGRQDFFIAQSIVVLKQRDILPANNNVVTHRINSNHDENRSQ